MCLLIPKIFNSVSWSLSSLRLITTPLLIAYVKILSKKKYIWNIFQLQCFTKNSIFSWNQEPRFLETFFFQPILVPGSCFLKNTEISVFTVISVFPRNQEPRFLKNFFHTKGRCIGYLAWELYIF